MAEDKSHDDLLACLQNTDQLNNTETCKDVDKTKVILKKPTFIYNSPVKKQNLKNCCGKQRRNRTLSAPYYLKSVDDAFKTLSIDAKSPNCHDDSTKHAVDKPVFSPLNKVPSLKAATKWRSSESIIKPSKLNAVDFHKCRNYKTKQISVGKWDNKKSNATFKELNYTSKKPCATKFSHNQSQSRTFSKSKTHQRPSLEKTCSFEARNCEVDMTPEELALYVEDYLVMPKKMSSMAEMMYL